MSQPQVPSRTMPGGYKDPQPATPEVQRLADQIRPDVEDRIGGLQQYKVEQYRTQVVAGINYAMKVRVADERFIHIKVYQPLGNAAPQLTGLEEGKTAADPIESIPSF